MALDWLNWMVDFANAASWKSDMVFLLGFYIGAEKKKALLVKASGIGTRSRLVFQGRVDRMVVDFPSAVLALQGGKPTACGGLAADLVVQGLAVDHLEGQADDTLVVAVLGNLSFLVDADRVDLIVVLSVLQREHFLAWWAWTLV